MTTTTTHSGGHLKRARNDAGLSQTALAIKCGLSQPYISEMERGEKPLSVYAATLVELALDLKPRALVRHAEDVPATLASLIPGLLNLFRYPEAAAA